MPRASGCSAARGANSNPNPNPDPTPNPNPDQVVATCERLLGCARCDFPVLLVNEPWYGGLSGEQVPLGVGLEGTTR